MASSTRGSDLSEPRCICQLRGANDPLGMDDGGACTPFPPSGISAQSLVDQARRAARTLAERLAITADAHRRADLVTVELQVELRDTRERLAALETRCARLRQANDSLRAQLATALTAPRRTRSTGTACKCASAKAAASPDSTTSVQSAKAPAVQSTKAPTAPSAASLQLRVVGKADGPVAAAAPASTDLRAREAGRTAVREAGPKAIRPARGKRRRGSPEPSAPVQPTLSSSPAPSLTLNPTPSPTDTAGLALAASHGHGEHRDWRRCAAGSLDAVCRFAADGGDTSPTESESSGSDGSHASDGPDPDLDGEANPLPPLPASALPEDLVSSWVTFPS